MESGNLLSKLPQRFRRFRERKIRERLTVFSVCVVIAAFLWLMIKLSDFYFDEISCPVSFQNLTNDKILAGYSDSSVTCRIETKGFKLLNLKWFQNWDLVNIDVSYDDLNSLDDNKKYNYFLLADNIQQELGSNFDESATIADIKPDTLFFWFDNKKSRKVPVQANLQIDYKSQFQPYKSIRLVPDSVVVEGPDEMIDTINSIRTQKFEATNVKEDIHEKLELPYDNPNLTLSSQEVRLDIDVEEFTESLVKIPVEAKNTGSLNKKIKTFPYKVEISFWVALKDYQKVTAAQFTASIDYQKVQADEGEKARVRITRFPSHVKNIRVNPRYVEYVIKDDTNEN